MDFWAKVEHFKKDMRARGGWWGLRNAVPPYLSLAWRLGIRARPPYFLGFWRCAIGMGVWFTLAFGIAMWFLHRPDAGLGTWLFFPVVIFGGGLFGVSTAGIWRLQSSTLGLPSWDEYPAEVASQDA